MPTIRTAARTAALLLFAAAVVLATAPATVAHTDPNHGTIKVHDGPTADPPQRNEPHVDCDFWVEGMNVSDGSGGLVFYSWPPTGNKTQVLTAEWFADAHDHEQGGFHFLAGPFTLPTGHYRVEASMTSGHPGNEDHFAKAKMFWVECQPLLPPPLECPPGELTAVAKDDGSIELSFAAATGFDGTNIYRAEGSGDFEYIATVDAETGVYVDEDTVVGVSYTYAITRLTGEQETEVCAEAMATAIPEFPTMLALAGAAVLGVAGYAILRRRRA